MARREHKKAAHVKLATSSKPRKPRKKAKTMTAPRKLYKGEIKTLGNLTDIAGVPVQVMENETPRGKLPRTFVILDRRDSYLGANWRQIKYLENGTVKRIDLPVTAEFNVLSGRRYSELQEQFTKYNIENIGDSACPVGNMVGSDPEIFVVDKDGEVIPAWKFLGGKSEKKNLGRASTGGSRAVYWDGFQAEFETYAATCLSWQVDSVQRGLECVLQNARAYDKHARLSLASVLPVPQHELDTAKSEHVEFGCMPSFNAYGIEGKRLPGREVPIRFAGGHIHFGGPLNDVTLKRTVKALDAILGVACVSLFENQDNPIRREFYGQPGEYRTPPHGMEYRTLSNAWLAHPLVMNMVFDLARRAYAYGYHNCTGWVATEKEVIDCITTHDVPKAREILKRNEAVLGSLIRTIGAGNYNGTEDTAVKAWMGPMDAFIKDPGDIEANWLLTGGWVDHCENMNALWSKAKVAVAAAITGGEKLVTKRTR